MKKKIIFKFFLYFIIFFPIDITFLEELEQEIITNDNSNNFKYYVGGAVVVLIIMGFLFYQGNPEFFYPEYYESDIVFTPQRRLEDFNPPVCPVYQINTQCNTYSK